MKIKQLIKELQKVEEEHGKLEVSISDTHRPSIIMVDHKYDKCVIDVLEHNYREQD